MILQSEPLNENDCAILSEKLRSHKIFLICMTGFYLLILGFATYIFIYTANSIFGYFLIIVLVIILPVNYNYLKKTRNFRKDLKNYEKIIHPVKLENKYYNNGEFYYVIDGKSHIVQSPDEYRNASKNDNIIIELLPHSKLLLGIKNISV